MSAPEGGRSAAMDSVVGYILLGGVVTSLALLTAGLLWRRAATGSARFDYELARMTVFQLVGTDVDQLATGEWRPRLLLNLGLAVLLLTPYVRVLASMLYFAVAERNAKYTAFTAFVLATLTYSLFLR